MMCMWTRETVALLLIVAVIAAHLFVVIGSVIECWMQIEVIVRGQFVCDDKGRLSEVLAAALAAALALLATRRE